MTDLVDVGRPFVAQSFILNLATFQVVHLLCAVCVPSDLIVQKPISVSFFPPKCRLNSISIFFYRPLFSLPLLGLAQ